MIKFNLLITEDKKIKNQFYSIFNKYMFELVTEEIKHKLYLDIKRLFDKNNIHVNFNLDIWNGTLFLNVCTEDKEKLKFLRNE